MYQPTRQTQNAIESMKAAGFKRSEFRARTEKNSRGEYGDVMIIAWNLQQAIDRSQAMVDAGLSVTHYTIDGIVKSVRISDEGYLPDNKVEVVEVSHPPSNQTPRTKD